MHACIFVCTFTHLYIDSPDPPPWDAKGQSRVRILHIAQHQEVKEEPANHLHQLLVTNSFILIHWLLVKIRGAVKVKGREIKLWFCELWFCEFCDCLIISEATTMLTEWDRYPLPPIYPHPWWQHSEVEEGGTVLLVEGQRTELGDSFQWGKCLIDSDS